MGWISWNCGSENKKNLSLKMKFSSQELAGKFFSLPLVELVEEGGGVRFQRSTDNILLNNMMIGGRPCLLGLLHPRLQLPQPDHTEQRAGLPHCQGGASQQQQQQRHISNNYPHHKLQKRITQSSE